jgi:cytochrome c
MGKKIQRRNWIYLGMVPVIVWAGWRVTQFRPKKQPPVNPEQSPPRSKERYIVPAGRMLAAQNGQPNIEREEGHSRRLRGDATVHEDVGAETISTGHALAGVSAEKISLLVLLVPFIILTAAIVVLSFGHIPLQSTVVIAGGNVQRGQVALQSWGCGSCHTIPGVAGANGKVGPDLKEAGLHSFIAGRLENTPENMILWIQKPQEISPGNGMPDTGVTANMARDMAAYLYFISSKEQSGKSLSGFLYGR